MKQHATCPVCRKNLNAEHETTESVVTSEDSIMMAIRAAAENRESSLRRTINVLNRSQTSSMPDVIPNPEAAAATDDSLRNNIPETFTNERHRRRGRLELDSDVDSDSDSINSGRVSADSFVSRYLSITSSSSSSSEVSANENPSDDVMIVSDISCPDEPQRSESNEECSQPSQKKSKSH